MHFPREALNSYLSELAALLRVGGNSSSFNRGPLSWDLLAMVVILEDAFLRKRKAFTLALEITSITSITPWGNRTRRLPHGRGQA